MRKGKKIKFSPQIIVIIVLLIMIILLTVILLAHRTSLEVKNRYYSDRFIKVENPAENMRVKANVIQGGGSLVMLLSSDDSSPRMATVNVRFFNDDNQVVYSDRFSTLVMNGGQALLSAPLPNLGDDYAGNILLDITDDSTSFDDYVENSEITYEETHVVLEDDTTVFNITGTNTSDTNIEHLVGSVVALKDDNIVAFNNFHIEDVEANSNFSTTVRLNGVLYGATVAPVKYDDILIFTSSATTV